MIKKIYHKWKELPLIERVGVPVSAIAATILFSMDTDSRPIPDYSTLRESQKEYTVPIDEKAAHGFATRQSRADIKKARSDFLEANGYTKPECSKCNFLPRENREFLNELESDLGIDPNVLVAMKCAESNGKHINENGRPTQSSKGAYGGMQIRKTGFNEAMDVFRHKEGKRHRSYLKKFGNALEKYSHLFKGDDSMIWGYVKIHEKTNDIAGAVNISLHKHREGGDINEALKNYNTGEEDKFRKPEAAQRYVDKVTKNLKFFNETCPAIWKTTDEFMGIESDFYDAHTNTYSYYRPCSHCQRAFGSR